MLFGVRLANEAYAPWKGQYLAYDRLKKLLREEIVDREGEAWSESDETRFVSVLDKELEKVYSFETNKYTELSDRVTEWESKVHNSPGDITDQKQMERDLESILEETTQLDHFSRLNYTGFQKIVKKHDRLHPAYQVKPLLHVRLNALPFHNEDYSPLLYRLSSLYGFLSENFGAPQSANSASARMSSFQQEGANAEYTAARFWVHPENVMEVKTRILRHLPVLVYNSEQNNNEQDANDHQVMDPTVTSVYFDNDDFELYESQLERTKPKEDGEEYLPSLRLRWYGDLTNNTNVQLERKDAGGVDNVGGGALKFKEKNVWPFVNSERAVVEKAIRKMKAKSATEAEVKGFEKLQEDLQSYIKDHSLKPIVRTVYTRTAFQIPGDDAIRIIMDSDISFYRAQQQQNPVKFPHCVLEIRLKAFAKHPTWIDDLMSSHLVKEVPHFSKFVHGVATLFAEDDRLDSLPFWLPDLELDIRQDPKMVYQDQKDRVKRHKEEMKRRASMIERTQPQSEQASIEQDEESSDGEASSSTTLTSSGRQRKTRIGYPTWTTTAPKLDMDSEDEEVELPAGVQKPRNLLRFAGEVKVETKVWLANERTFNKWLSITTMLSALTFALYNSVQKSHSESIAEKVAYLLFALTLFSGLWGYYTYVRRLRFIRQRSERHLDAPLGPIVLAVTLLLALTVNFYSTWKYHQKFTPTITDPFI